MTVKRANNKEMFVPNNWLVRTPWDNEPFPESSLAGAAQPDR